MNRHERRAAAKKGGDASVGAVEPAPQRNLDAPPAPSLALRLVARVLLADWVLKRVHHPDLLAILLQIAQQVARADVVARITTALHSVPR
jgi:hypothetical protein